MKQHVVALERVLLTALYIGTARVAFTPTMQSCLLACVRRPSSSTFLVFFLRSGAAAASQRNKSLILAKFTSKFTKSKADYGQH